MKLRHVFLGLVLTILSAVGQSQEKTKLKQQPGYSPDNYDIFDKSRAKKKAKAAESGDTTQTVKQDTNKKIYAMGLPVVGFNPFLGLVLGAAGNISFRLGDPETTRLSTMIPSFTWSTTNSLAFRVNNQLYGKDENLIMFNSIRWTVMPQSTYGIGGNTPTEWESSLQPSTIYLTSRAYKRVKGHFYLGLGYTLDYKYEVKDLTGDDIAGEINDNQNSDINAAGNLNRIDSDYGGLTSYWEQEGIEYDADYNNDYETMTGEEIQQKYFPTPFGSYAYGHDEYVLSGLSVMAQYDTRDNINSTYTGSYINLMYTNYGKWIGSDYNYNFAYFDMRHFIPLKENNTQILGFWGMGMLTFGDVPYANMPMVGGDDWFASGRGYTAGRYRGEKYLYFETEYRLNIKKWFGMTFFGNIHSVSEEDGGFEYVNPGYGVGFRIKALKASRTNICVDYGRGKDGSSGLYMRFIEAF